MLFPFILSPVFVEISHSEDSCSQEYNPGSFGEPDMYQIIITEIMADPYPPAGLPDAEYIELYNRGESDISLSGCRLVLGNKQKSMSAVIIESHACLIVCDAEDEHLFSLQGKTLPIEKMPPIVNSGMVITIKSASGKIIHSVEFTDHWFRSAEKAEGGWSLEMIDLNNFCGRADNWRESTDPCGGTPGSPNSVSAINSDKLKPKLLRATLNADSSVMLHFSESMDSTSMTGLSQYSASHSLLQPVRIDPAGPLYRSASLAFGNHLFPYITYSVTVMHTLQDCVGNKLDFNASTDFALPQTADSFDVILNEILFDAPDGISEFIELYNRSNKVIDLAQFSIALLDMENDSITRQIPLKTNSFLLFPGHCVAITCDADHMTDFLNLLDYSSIAEYTALFTLPDKEGEIVLLGNSSQTIDKFHYSSHMHSEFLSETEGISLERISVDEPTNEANNWYSAASTAGFATPGYENSQASVPATESDNITLAPVVFSPDGDGTDDAAVLSLISGDAGFIANICIYDAQGTKIKTLASGALLGTETVMVWDGSRNDNTLADMGIYVIYIELFNQKGTVKKYRKVITLARKL